MSRRTATGRLMGWEQLGTRSWGLGVAADILSLEERLTALEQKQTSVGVAGMDPATDRKSAATHGACASPCSQPFDSAPITLDAYRQFVGEVMNWVSEATGFLHDDVLRTDDARDFIHNACMRCWDAFDRIAYPTIHGAAPVATARTDADSDRTDKAAPRPGEGAGDTPVTHATPGEGSVPREGTQEPVAWAVRYRHGDTGIVDLCRTLADCRAKWSNRTTDYWLYEPLYRHPPCQDFSQKNLTLTDCERGAIERAVDSIAATMPYESQQGLADWKTLRGLLRRMGGAK